ncbi:hypothetical protein K8I28_03095 [bacterium]|nr:hypothetical protein [bacterium]
MRKTMLILLGIAMLATGSMAGTLMGQVVNGDGDAVGDAYVWYRAANVDRDNPDRVFHGRMMTGDRGQFIIEGVPGTVLHVYAAKDNLGRTMQTVRVPADGIVRVQLTLPGNDRDRDRRDDRRRQRRGPGPRGI